MNRSKRARLFTTALAWTIAFVLFFPIMWMFVTSFKTEVEAVATPPSIYFAPTLQNYRTVQQQSTYVRSAVNSIVISVTATSISLAMAIAAAYSLAFFPTKRTRMTLLWMLSTKMLPSVGVLVPVYMLFRDLRLIDTRVGLVIVYVAMNLPIMVWMLFTFFREIPPAILEAGRMDGAKPKHEILYVLLPLTLPGISSTAMLSIILCWNEAFWSLNLTTSDAAPLSAFIASFSAPEGLFWAKLSAASTLAAAPILLLGWLSQRQLVRGLTFGAVK